MKDDFKFEKASKYVNTPTIATGDSTAPSPPYAPAELSAANAGITRFPHGWMIVSDGTSNCPECALAILTSPQGTKHDSGKPDLSLVSSELMVALAEVRQFGATKYHRDNWKLGFKYTRSIAAALRHIMAFKDGEDLDGESGLTHIAHAIASLEHLLYDYTHHKDNDDRKGS